jgi:hypothetical protein
MLKSVFPNPFRRGIKVFFSLSYDDISEMNFQLFDLKGRLVGKKTVSRGLCPGLNTITWTNFHKSGDRIAGGIYLFRMSIKYRESNKIVIFKKQMTCLP